jgi:hypothetical protein
VTGFLALDFIRKFGVVYLELQHIRLILLIVKVKLLHLEQALIFVLFLVIVNEQSDSIALAARLVQGFNRFFDRVDVLLILPQILHVH